MPLTRFIKKYSITNLIIVICYYNIEFLYSFDNFKSSEFSQSETYVNLLQTKRIQVT